MNGPTDSLALQITFRTLFEAEQWQRLVERAERIELPAGKVVLRRGEPTTGLYVIQEGTFEVVDTRSSPATVLDMLGPGFVIGDLSYIDGAPAPAEVRAHTHAVTLRWSPGTLNTLLADDPDLAVTFYRALASVVVARTRTVLSAAIVGGFGVGRDRPEAPEADTRVADTFASTLREHLTGTTAHDVPGPKPQVREALTEACRWFMVNTDGGRVEEVGARIRELLADLLQSASTSRAMLNRPDGVPASPDLFRHVLDGRPEGRNAAGTLLDAALLDLPVFRGWRWRDRQIAHTLREALPRDGARVLSVSLSGAPTSSAQLAPLREAFGHVTSVQLSPPSGPSATPIGITRTTVVADLPSLLRGTGPRVGGAHHVVTIDRVCDVVPDEVLRSLLAWARLQLEPSGQLILGHATPSDDAALLDHLLRWPSLPRRAPAVTALLPRGGAWTTATADDDEAAGLVVWRARA